MQTSKAIQSIGMMLGMSWFGLQAAHAQLLVIGSGADTAAWRSGQTLGLNPAKVRFSVTCGSSILPCRDDAAALAATSAGSPLRWSVELERLPSGTASRFTPTASLSGLNLSLVGSRTLFGSGLSVYGKLGATYGLVDPVGSLVPAPAAEAAYGMSFGAGLSLDVTPRLSATLGWDSQEMRLGTGPRDAVRSTSLGLQFRY